MTKFLMGFFSSYFSGDVPYSTGGLAAKCCFSRVKAGDRVLEIMIPLKYIYDLLHDPEFSPNITTA